ncbi:MULTISPECIES: hypothetical protein [unclassified Microbacterium]|uniref:hypothetical protein n=1 Tax=unclassified Microbacterium TaxID=2609290 RepID=UPI00214B623A|nr:MULTISPECIES: hypothetical protein [unclassified Microbacterium]MCR2810982.1 hypothetical protein [Microbacterium sp. zg.B185]WIM19620.1 hypothetical protein QNO12_02090 [Microbacterium sp. zg-B185]
MSGTGRRVQPGTGGSTSTQRTHRYLRLGIGGTLVVLLIAIILTVPTVGWLPSLSDYFYTPARSAFVGALLAASLALLALSGRNPERSALDAAALFAPLVALIPSVIRPGTVPGVAVACTGCVPASFEADVVNGVTTYLIVLGAGLVLATVLAVRGAIRGVRFSLILGGLVLAVVLVTGLVAPGVLLGWGHIVATGLFLGSIAADALINAFWRTTSATPPRWLRIAYLGLAVILIADLLALAAFAIATRDAERVMFPWILVGEVVALLAFVTFWWLQTWQRWDETDPASLVAASPRLPPLRATR